MLFGLDFQSYCLKACLTINCMRLPKRFIRHKVRLASFPKGDVVSYFVFLVGVSSDVRKLFAENGTDSLEQCERLIRNVMRIGPGNTSVTASDCDTRVLRLCFQVGLILVSFKVWHCVTMITGALTKTHFLWIPNKGCRLHTLSLTKCLGTFWTLNR